MAEVTATVKQNADHSQQANQLAVAASDIAARGGSVVDQVIVTMQDIEASSNKVVDIIGTIGSGWLTDRGLVYVVLGAPAEA